ncbi:MAG: GGDEF domain-containing protein [Thermoleophilia bacterium]
MQGKTGFTIAGRIIFANCAIVGASAFSGTWLSQHYVESSTFVMGAILFVMGLILSLPVNYIVLRLALKPLRSLAATMEEVQRGNLGAGPTLRRSADPQIDRLLASYDTMIDWIREDRRTIEKMSLIDPLTEVGNTRALHRGLETEIARIDRYGQTMPAAFSVLIMDLDRFKQINDTFGHMTGDAVLREVAEVLQENLRKTDTALVALQHFRFGGDEFVVIAPHTGAAGARVLADRLDTAISNHDFCTQDGRSLRNSAVGQVRASIGYASYPEETANEDELLELADKRMYAVKEERSRQQGPRSLPTAAPEQGWHLGQTGTYQ